MYHILVVDDEARIRSIIRVFLRVRDFIKLEAHTVFAINCRIALLFWKMLRIARKSI